MAIPGRASAIDKALTPATPAAEREGLAAAILIDVSGSMERPAGKGSGVPKIVSARRAAIDLVDQFARYADDHKNEPVLLGIYEFSATRRQAGLPRSHADGPTRSASARAAAIDGMQPDGGTPIGYAMIAGKLALDATGLSRRHLLVVTDGENTDGFDAGRGRRRDRPAPVDRASVDLLRRVRHRRQSLRRGQDLRRARARSRGCARAE